MAGAVVIIALLGASDGAGPGTARLRTYLRELSRSGPPWRPETVRQTVRRIVAGLGRPGTNLASRRALVDDLRAADPPEMRADLREILLSEMDHEGGFSFDDLERLQLAWGAVPRASASRRVAYRGRRWRFPADDGDTIEASIYSLPSDRIEAAPAEKFLIATRAVAPRRQILVLVDPANRAELQDFANRNDVTLLDTFGHDYSMWPRDTFSFVRDASGNPGVIERPSGILQGQRTIDNTMGREIIKDLPGPLDLKWGKPWWTVSPVPFHNGQILLTRDAAWISLHSLEPRILGLLHLDRVPVASFGRSEGIDRYLDAAGAAAAELASLYGRPVRFVHSLPRTGSSRERSAEMESVGGGAGFDLDSYLTLLRNPDGEEAMVADVRSGRALLEEVGENDLRDFISAYGLTAGPEGIRRALIEFTRSNRAMRFQSFLDLVAAELAADGLRVNRLPVLLVPTGALSNRNGLESELDFLISWNNVVVETGRSGNRVEGFSSLLSAGDAEARALFARAGFRLDFLPPLVASVVRNGGYRCASNHLRG